MTQSELSSLLIEHSTPQSYVTATKVLLFINHVTSVAAPSEDKKDVPADPPKLVDLSVAISSITQNQKVYTVEKLPPTLPVPRTRWVPQLAPAAPHDPHAYFPMLLYK